MVSQHPHPTHPTLRRNTEHLVASGAHVDVVCMTPSGFRWGFQAGERLRLFGLPMGHKRSLIRYPIEYFGFAAWALFVVSWLSLRGRYDVVQVDTLPDLLVFSTIVPRVRQVPIVLYVYDLMPEMTMSRLGVGDRHPLVRVAVALEAMATRYADHVITVTDLFRRRLARRGLDERRTTVVANSHPMAGVRRENPAQPPVLVLQTTVIERYGVQVAVRALAELKDRHPTLRLKVLGEGEYLPVVRNLAADLGIADRVEFSGRYLPWHEAMAQVAQASIGIVPIISDGYGDLILPNKVLELAAMGVPVACSRLDGIAEHFPEDALAYFTPGDHRQLAAQIARLLADPPAALEQGGRAKLAMESLRWENASRIYLHTLEGGWRSAPDEPAITLGGEPAG
jgi:glycosyltransferase involved in cell wall biosynthesis